MGIASITSSLAPLALLACPVGMGAMMWMMARGTKRRQPSERPHEPGIGIQPASLDLFREEHRRLGEEIERLEREQGAETSQRR